MPIPFLSQESPNPRDHADTAKFVRDESARDGSVVRLLFMLLCVRISERERQYNGRSCTQERQILMKFNC